MQPLQDQDHICPLRCYGTTAVIQSQPSELPESYSGDNIDLEEI